MAGLRYSCWQRQRGENVKRVGLEGMGRYRKGILSLARGQGAGVEEMKTDRWGDEV